MVSASLPPPPRPPPPPHYNVGLNLKICQNFVGTNFFLNFVGNKPLWGGGKVLWGD